MSGLVLAAQYLTIVPLGRNPTHEDAAGRSAAWFPVVGLGIGLAILVVERVTGRIFPVLLGALFTVTAWKLLTGGLHLDGLADCLDGLAGRDADQRIRIMRDSRIGAFGAMGLILFLLTEVVAVAELAPALRWRAVLAAPVIARAMPPLLARWFPPARPDGHGAAFAAGVQPVAVPLALGVAAVVGLGALGLLGIVALAVAALAALAVGWFMAGRLDGITGDVHGAAVEVAELTVLLTVAAWVHGAR
ncbi:MAG TPA: adenosylcobinamide-GDP ribazoletransferase [Methylomirabilota bacterium]|nr:adenosylcobinamide-GDP ribazoletransferase [Methylomirabilota bacterium]